MGNRSTTLAREPEQTQSDPLTVRSRVEFTLGGDSDDESDQGYLSAMEDLSVKDDSSVKGNLSITDDRSVTREFPVHEDLSATNDLSVKDGMSTTENLSIKANLSMTDNRTVTEDHSIQEDPPATNDLSANNAANQHDLSANIHVEVPQYICFLLNYLHEDLDPTTACTNGVFTLKSPHKAEAVTLLHHHIPASDPRVPAMDLSTLMLHTRSYITISIRVTKSPTELGMRYTATGEMRFQNEAGLFLDFLGYPGSKLQVVGVMETEQDAVAEMLDRMGWRDVLGWLRQAGRMVFDGEAEPRAVGERGRWMEMVFEVEGIEVSAFREREGLVTTEGV